MSGERVYTQTYCVVGAIVEQNGKILLVKENNPAHPDHGKWNQPAGWLDVGEDPVVAVRREVKEETGFDFTPTHLLGVYSLVKPQNPRPKVTSHGVKLIFTGDIRESPDKPDASEISAIRWFTPEDIYAMDRATLRDSDIKREIRDYFSGRRYPLALVTHTVQG